MIFASQEVEMKSALSISILAGLLALPAIGLSQGVPSLGSAGDFAVLGGKDGKIDITKDGTRVNGNVGIGSKGDLDVKYDATINGSIFADPSAALKLDKDSTVTGSVSRTSVNAANSAARSASQAMANLQANAVLASISNSTGTLNLSQPLTVFDVKGDFELKKDGILTLSGVAGSQVVMNIYGDMKMSYDSQVKLVGGLTADSVFYNFIGYKSKVDLDDSTLNGTILAMDKDVTLKSSILNGNIYSGEDSKVYIKYGSVVNGVNPVPEPGTMAVLGLGAAAAAYRRRRKSKTA